MVVVKAQPSLMFFVHRKKRLSLCLLHYVSQTLILLRVSIRKVYILENNFYEILYQFGRLFTYRVNHSTAPCASCL